MLSLALAALSLSRGIAAPPEEFVPAEGDLLFQTAGNSVFSDAIADATASGGITYVHVAIAAGGAQGLSPMVIEASPDYGVRTCTLSEFLENSPHIDGSPGVVVMRIGGDYDGEAAVKKAMTFLGEPYDWYYMPNNGRMYCSELVYESFLDENGNPFFQSVPMNFRDSEGNMPEFWVDLYRTLGMDVPEGLPGTNPNDLSLDSRLVEVHRYF